MDSGPSSDPQLLARLHDLELRSRAVADSLMPGRHRHPRAGWSVEFSQHREYSPGDDLRYVDWKATARSDRLLLRQYQDETAMVAWVVVDATPSMSFRGARSNQSKLEIASTIAAAIAWIVIRQRDAVGLCLVTSSGVETLAASDAPAHWHAITRALASVENRAAQASNHEEGWHRGLQQVASQVRAGSVIFALSDWVDDPSYLRGWLALLRDQRRADVRVVQCLDPDELSLDEVDATHFAWLEGTDREVPIEPRQLATAYRDEVERSLRELSDLFHGFQIPFVSVLSGDDLVPSVRSIILRSE